MFTVGYNNGFGFSESFSHLCKSVGSVGGTPQSI